jgi:hypothetical protein
MVVGAADYTMARFARLDDESRGRRDGNGIVDTNDCTVWKSSFGACGSGASSDAVAAVPEPRGCTLWVGSLLLIVCPFI